MVRTAQLTACQNYPGAVVGPSAQVSAPREGPQFAEGSRATARLRSLRRAAEREHRVQLDRVLRNHRSARIGSRRTRRRSRAPWRAKADDAARGCHLRPPQRRRAAPASGVGRLGDHRPGSVAVRDPLGSQVCRVSRLRRGFTRVMSMVTVASETTAASNAPTRSGRRRWPRSSGTISRSPRKERTWLTGL
jgi:hypothetical protein